MDSVDQIAELTKNWGGYPERLYGVGLHNYARPLMIRGAVVTVFENLFKGVFQNYGFTKADEYRHPFLFDTLKEIAVAFGTGMPRNVYIAHDAPARYIAVSPLTRDMVISSTALKIFQPDEMKAILGHEMHHFTQERDGKFTSRTMIGLAQRMIKQAAKNDVSFTPLMSQILNRYMEDQVKKVTQAEFDADAAGAKFASPEAMISGLVKMLAYDFGWHDIQASQEQMIQAITREFGKVLDASPPEEKVVTGYYRFSDRIQHIRSSGAPKK